MTERKSSTARRLTLMAGVAAAVLAVGDAGFGPTRIALPANGEGGVRVEAVRLESGLFAAAFAQSEITLENVTIDAGPSVYRLPSLTFSGANLSRDELLGVLRGKGGGAWHESLARISADSITAPELVVEQTMDGADGTITYLDIAAEGVENGRIASLVVGSAEIAAEADDQDVDGTVGEMRVTDFDLPFAVRWYVDAAPEGGDNPFRTVYDSFSVSDMAFGDAEATVRIASISGDGVSARLMQTPFAELMPEMQAMSEGDEPTDAETRRIMGMMADMLGAMELGSIAMEDITFTITELGDEPAFGIARIAIGEAEGGLRMDEVFVDTPEAQVAIAAITSSGFDTTPMIEGFRKIAENPDLEMDAATARALMPTIGTWRLEGLDAAVTPEGESEPIAVALGAFEMTADEPVNGTPSNIRVGFDNLAFAIPKKSEEDAAVQLLALGYGDLDLSGVFAARWNQETEEVVIEEVSISGVEMGRFALSGAFGGIGPEAFAGDETAMMMAWLGATAKSMQISVSDEGFAERVLAFQADEQGVPAEDLRAQAAMMSRAMLPAMLGGTAEARALGDALAAFVEAPGELDVKVTSTDPAGIPVMEFTAVENPMEFLPRISIEAESR
ncbi:hypothetical protein [Salinarimonas sp.]|uniref:hypothetical protein n=1 Tax=Salinarimonas sp. TaxID=2766526 RepID=UPI0032D9724A